MALGDLCYKSGGSALCFKSGGSSLVYKSAPVYQIYIKQRIHYKCSKYSQEHDIAAGTGIERQYGVSYWDEHVSTESSGTNKYRTYRYYLKVGASNPSYCISFYGKSPCKDQSESVNIVTVRVEGHGEPIIVTKSFLDTKVVLFTFAFGEDGTITGLNWKLENI